MSNPKGPLRSVRTQVTEGIFGKHTAVVDFCEDNYQVTPYIAEFTNTISNVAYLVLGGIGIYYARQEKLPRRTQVCHASLIGIGIGSTIFHATLMKTAMMMDDLPMIWQVSILLYSIAQPDAKSRINWPMAVFLLAVNIAIIGCDLAEVNQWFHYTAFAALAIAAALRFVYLVMAYPKALDAEVRKSVLQYFGLGTLSIVAAFTIWNIDNLYCDDIYVYKQKLGLPSAFILEGHAYWHLLTAYGAFLVVTSGSCITLAVQEKSSLFGLKKGVFGLPYVVRTGKAKRT